MNGQSPLRTHGISESKKNKIMLQKWKKNIVYKVKNEICKGYKNAYI
jgi:hypothetical protein